MKKQSIFIGLLALFFVAQAPLFAMSPAQVQGKIQDFNRVLGKYKQEIDAGRGLTPDTKGLKKEAEDILNEIRPYTTVAVFENSLQAAETRAQATYEQAATDAMDTVINILGVVGGRRPFFTRQDYKDQPHNIYKNITDKLLKDIYTVIARLYPTDKTLQSKTRIVNNSLVLGAPSRAREDVRELALLSKKNQGGALYWFNQHINNTFDVLNIFGDIAGNEIYGTQQLPTTAQSYTAFLTATNTLFTNIYPVGDNLMVRENDVLQLSVSKPNSLYEIKEKTGKMLFGHLASDLDKYNKLVSFVTGHGIESEQYSPNVTQALKTIQTIAQNFKFQDIPQETTLSSMLEKAQKAKVESLKKETDIQIFADMGFTAFEKWNELADYITYESSGEKRKPKTVADILDVLYKLEFRIVDSRSNIVKIKKQDNFLNTFQAAFDAGVQNTKKKNNRILQKSKENIVSILSSIEPEYTAAVKSKNSQDFLKVIQKAKLSRENLEKLLASCIVGINGISSLSITT